MIARIANHLEKEHQSSLQTAPAELVVQALKELGITSMWLQMDEELQDWERGVEHVEELMLGDCEFEVRLVFSLFYLPLFLPFWSSPY